MRRKVVVATSVAEWGKPRKGQAKVLILDIETAPIKANVWRIWKENVGLNQIDKDWFMLSFSAKWLGDKWITYFDQKGRADIEDDAPLLAELHTLLDEADIVVAHNGRKFDLKKINARFLAHGFKPPSPYKIVDTLEIAKAKFAFTSNKLAYLTERFNKDYKKLEHGKFPGYELWRQVLLANKEAWAEMRTYNEYDVLALEELYVTLRPWDDRHPNVNAYSPLEDTACPICGGLNMGSRGFSYTNTGKYPRYRCEDCGAWSRGRYTVNTIAKRKALLSK